MVDVILTPMGATTERNIAVTTHGRYLVRPGSAASPVLVGFHGYAEAADVQMLRLASIPGLDAWTLISVQGLHRFYRRRSDEVVASWMTRQDRELMIADNIDYVSAIVAEVAAAPDGRQVVFAGFSQGVAMAFRAGCAGRHTPAAVVACGGDVPPELGPDALRRLPRVVIGRGRDDASYRDATFSNDLARLRAGGVAVDPIVFEGAHEWAPSFAVAVGAFLRGLGR